MDIRYIYIIEINAICLIICSMILYQLLGKKRMSSSANNLFCGNVICAMVLCVCDIVASCSDGNYYPGVGLVLEVSNMLFFEGLTFLAYLWMLYFLVFPALTSIIQMFCYGITLLQVGTTLAIITIYFSGMNMQILTDTLTGLNNRAHMDVYINDYLTDDRDKRLTFFMMDINRI